MKKAIMVLLAVIAFTALMPAKEVKAAYNILEAGSQAELLRSLYNVPALEADLQNKYNYYTQLIASGASQGDIDAARTVVDAASMQLTKVNATIAYQMSAASQFPVPATYTATLINEPIYAALYTDKSIYATALNNQAIYNSQAVNQAAYNAVLATNGAYAVDMANVTAYNAYYHGQAPYPW